MRGLTRIPPRYQPLWGLDSPSAHDQHPKTAQPPPPPPRPPPLPPWKPFVNPWCPVTLLSLSLHLPSLPALTL
jgi:hypothetical protein